MRVLHVSTVCGFGGVEAVLPGLIREQRAAGMDPEAFFFRDLGGSSRFAGLCRLHFGDTDSLASVIRGGGYDVVHAASHVTDELHRALRKARYSGAVVITCHQCSLFDRDIESAVVTAVSRAAAESIQPRCATAVEVVPNGIDTSVFRPGSAEAIGDRAMAWVGRSDDDAKDFPGFVALANAVAGMGLCPVVVDGSPGAGSASRDWLPPGTVVVDRKRWEEMPDFYRGIRASRGFVVSTSRTESCGLSLLEAQACGCPVVAPAVDGIPEHVLHERTGYLYNRDAAAGEIVRAVDWLYAGDRYEQVSEAAIEHVRNGFSAAAMQRRYAEVYERAMGCFGICASSDLPGTARPKPRNIGR